MNKPRYFSLEELIRSDTAVSKKIPNLPTWDIIDNLNRLALFLDDMRDAYGKPIYVSSGFRCVELNKALKGSSTSVHPLGWAVDLYVKGGKKAMDAFTKWVEDYLADKMFDQLLKESNSAGGYWLHFGLFNGKGQQRRQIKTLVVQ